MTDDGRHSGTEPRTARSALRLRLLLSSVFLPLFLAGTALFWFWTTRSGPGDAPSSGSLRVLTLMCAGLSLFALTDLLVVLHRRRGDGRGGSRGDGQGIR